MNFHRYRYVLAAVILLSFLVEHCRCFRKKDLQDREFRKIGGLLKQLNKQKPVSDPAVSNELIIPNLKLPRKVIWTPFRKLDRKHLFLDVNTELKYNPELSKVVDQYTQLLATLQPSPDQKDEATPSE